MNLTASDDKYKKLYDTPLKRSVFYLIGSLILLYLFASVFPFLLDYYVEGSKENVFSYVYTLSLSGLSYYDYEIMLVFLVSLFLFALTQSPGWSVGILSVSGIILAYAGKIKYENRMELINYTDLKLTEAASTFAEYLKFRPALGLLYLFLFSILMTGIGIAIHLLVRKDLKSLWKPILGIQLALVVLSGSVTVLYQINFIKKEHSRGIDQAMEYLTENADHFLIYHFLASEQISYAPSEAKESYDHLMDLVKEQEIPLRTISGFNLQNAPSVIVIMNESWWDLDHIPKENVTFSSDPMKPLHELEGDCSIGTVGVNIYGGGTICSEEEYKLGFNTKYFSSSLTIYKNLAERYVPSITEYFNTLGYRTTAIHPYYGDFYGRTELYKGEGYQNILFINEMDHKKPYDRYISDEAMVDQIIEEFEKGKSQESQESAVPNYIFALSIASHVTNLDYEEPLNKDFDYPIQISLPDGVKLQNEHDIIHYVNGIYYSNLAIQKLIRYLKEQDRPVMVIMFGDHCPGINVYDLRSLGLEAGGEGADHVGKMQVNPGLMGDPVTDEILEALYTTPCLEWDNFSNEPFVCDKENVSQLSRMIIDHASLPDTPISAIQKLLRNNFRTDIRAFRTDPEGNRIGSLTPDQYDVIQKYLMVQYDSLYGDQVCGNLWEPIQ